MTKRLILIRHAKSSWDHPGPDHDRPLNTRGYAAAMVIGPWLKDHDYWPDEVLCSSAKRTVETCASLGFTDHISYRPDLYHASPEAILSALQEAQADTVALISHNPGIGELAYRLADPPPTHPRFIAYPTCATTVFDFAIDDWASLGATQPRLIDFVVPRDLM